MAHAMKDRCMNCFIPKDGTGACPDCGWDAENPGLQSTQRLKPGTILNGVYAVGKVLGQGGFGITYLAWDLHGGRKVAIKECFPDNPRAERTTDGRTVTSGGTDRGEKALFEAAVAKFIQEASTLSQFYLEPEIVKVLGVFRENNTAYMVMEHLEGHSLGEEIKKMKRLSAERVEEVALSVCRGLKAVHGRGILHRDVSPDNIFVTDGGAIKLIDFGTAREMGGNRTLTVNLKHGYAPKEQYTGRNQGPWTDIYALGATMYRALTGKMPPHAEEREVEDGIRSPSELGLKLPERLEGAVMKALSVEIEERFGDVGEFVEALTGGEVTLRDDGEEEDFYTQKTVWYRGPEKPDPALPAGVQEARGESFGRLLAEAGQLGLEERDENPSKKVADKPREISPAHFVAPVRPPMVHEEEANVASEVPPQEARQVQETVPTSSGSPSLKDIGKNLFIMILKITLGLGLFMLVYSFSQATAIAGGFGLLLLVPLMPSKRGSKVASKTPPREARYAKETVTYGKDEVAVAQEEPILVKVAKEENQLSCFGAIFLIVFFILFIYFVIKA